MIRLVSRFTGQPANPPLVFRTWDEIPTALRDVYPREGTEPGERQSDLHCWEGTDEPMALTVYISGPITGQEHDYRERFGAGAEAVAALGHEAVNPAAGPEIEGSTWADYMRRDLPLLIGCNAIYLLPGWETSRGSRLELHIARELGMQVICADGAEEAAS